MNQPETIKIDDVEYTRKTASVASLALHVISSTDDKTERLEFKLTHDMKAKLVELAVKRGASIGAIVRSLIGAELSRASG